MGIFLVRIGSKMMPRKLTKRFVMPINPIRCVKSLWSFMSVCFVALNYLIPKFGKTSPCYCAHIAAPNYADFHLFVSHLSLALHGTVRYNHFSFISSKKIFFHIFIGEFRHFLVFLCEISFSSADSPQELNSIF